MPALQQSVLKWSWRLSISFLVFLIRWQHLRYVIPLYGSVATTAYVNWVQAASLILALYLPAPIEWSITALGPLLMALPYTGYFLAAVTARIEWTAPPLGPIVTHLIALGPITYFAASLQMKVLNSSDAMRHWCIFQGAAWTRLEHQFEWNLWLAPVPDAFISKHLGFAVVLLSIYYFHRKYPYRLLSHRADTKTQGASSKLAFEGVLLAFAIVGLLTHKAPLPTTLRNGRSWIQPQQPVEILSSVNSVTGRIVVGQIDSTASNLPNLRYLRADHSLLGGVWYGDYASTLDNSEAPLDAFGTPIGDSIYHAFVLQEAARLVKSTGAKEFKSALTIGLGAGIAATAFAKHGLQNTIVEIDPAVYDAARVYFGLPDPGSKNVHIIDARKFVESKSSQSIPEQYDIVVHDCFSGGGVPQHIYTREFWDSLRKMISPHGVLTVNIAGVLASDSLKSVVVTLESVFPQCTALHDYEGDLTEQKVKEEFLNLVIFCTISPKPIQFRSPKTRDFLNSHARSNVLSALEKRRVDLAVIRGHGQLHNEQWILRDSNNTLGKWQKEGALDHWKVMRKVLPESYWEIY